MLNGNTMQTDGKNIAIIYVGDNSGCSHVRLRYNALYFSGLDLGVTPIVMPVYTFDPALLAHAKSIVFQRPVSKTHIELVQRYKSLQTKFGYKLVFEIDLCYLKGFLFRAMYSLASFSMSCLVLTLFAYIHSSISSFLKNSFLPNL